MLIYILIALICGSVNCGNVHKGLQSSLSPDGELTQSVLENGVEIDATFKGPSGNSEQYPSSPGCPSPTDGYPWVLYGTPPKCYLSGFQGPCHHSTKMTYHSSLKNGTCECDCLPNDPTARVKPFCARNDYDPEPRATFSEAEQCYSLFLQGPCRFDEWFVMDATVQKGICEKRRCPREKKSGQMLFYSRKTQSCEIYDELCKSEKFPDGRDKNFYYRFVEGFWEPQCIQALQSVAFGAPYQINPHDCRDDETYSKSLRKCLKPFAHTKSIG